MRQKRYKRFLILGMLLMVLFSFSRVKAMEGGEESIYVDRYDQISAYALNYAEVVTNNYLMEDTGIRIKDEYVAVNVTLQGNLKWTVRDFKVVPKQNMIVSTNADGFFTNSDKITIDYKNVGTYRGKSIGIKTVLYPANLTSAEKTLFKQVGEAGNINGAADNLAANYSCIFLEDTHVYAYKEKANFLHGIRYSNSPRMQVSYEMYYSDTGANIQADSMYFTWGSQNMGEGISSNNTYTNYYKVSGAFPEVYSISKSAKHGNIQFTNSLTSYTQAYISYNPNKSVYYYYNTDYDFLANCSTNEFEDNINGSDFWKSAATMYVASDDGIYRFRMLSKSFWFVPMLAPIGATAPAPVKSITQGDSEVTVVERKAGESIEFNISQQVETYGYTGSGYLKYSNFSFSDTLPEGVDYQDASVSRVYNGTTMDVTKKGILSYNPTTRKVVFSFHSTYVSDEMLYQGETYVLKIKCTLKSEAPEKITNQGETIICNDEQLTNVVTVNHPLYSISGRCWEDLNRNGQQEDTEPALTGVMVQLLQKGEDGIYEEVKDMAATSTGADGSYQFTGIPSGIYGIRFLSGTTNLVKYTASPENQGNDETDSDAVPEYVDQLLQRASILEIDTSGMTRLENGYFTRHYYDAGFFLKRGSITIKKINDDGNALSGTEFCLEKKVSGNWIVVQMDSPQTDENGILRYEDLEPGSYRITERNSPSGTTLLKKQMELELPFEKEATGDTESEHATYTENGKNYYLDVTYTIQNGQNFGMPVSGGSGIWIFMVVGIVLIATGINIYRRT